MVKNRRLVVHGQQRKEIDPGLLVQVLLAIDREWREGQRPPAATFSGLDSFGAAIEDNEAAG